MSKYVFNALTSQFDITSDDVEGLPEGGTTDQVLAKASGADYDTKWVTPSGGGGSGTLDDVLAAGNTASEKSMTLLGDDLPVSIRLTREPSSAILSNNLLTFTNASESEFDGTTDVQSNLISMMTYSGNNEITLRNGTGEVGPSMVMMKAGAPRTITLDSSPIAGEFLLPSTDGPEVFATREWVVENGSSGGQTLQEVMDASNETSVDIYMTDGAGVFMSSPDTDSYYIGLSIDSVGTGRSILPETDGEETLATREWVTASGATGSRPAAPVAGRMFFDTTLGHPIWYSGTQWVDATGTGV